MAGEVASLLLSRVTVPVLYYVANARRAAQPPSDGVAHVHFPNQESL
jgi:hypothetical protein